MLGLSVVFFTLFAMLVAVVIFGAYQLAADMFAFMVPFVAGCIASADAIQRVLDKKEKR